MPLSKFFLLQNLCKCYKLYSDDPKFLDRQVLPNSVDPAQTAPVVWLGSTKISFPFASFGGITVL